MYPPHPAANVFPLMDDHDFKGLVEDVKANGLRMPIVLFRTGEQTLTLDGRNRARACDVAGVEPRYETYTGDDPVRYVVSVNIARRHLSVSQRAAIALELYPLLAPDEAVDRTPHGKFAKRPDHVTQADVAALMDVSPRLVQTASAVKQGADPEVYDAVKRGDLSLNAADEISRLERDQQADAIRDRKQHTSDPKISKACRLSDAELDGLAQLFRYGEGSPSKRVREGAAALTRLVPAVRQ